ncbi:MAG: hypothetical protein KIT09_28715 [Bryobacteraceae bacterium]|nr:hypothetical protein [Bryobacteraceae bacterium]
MRAALYLTLALALCVTVQGQPTARSIPVIHTTDLFHPPADPDDHVDLATAFAFAELDLRAILLDSERRLMRPGRPGDPPREPGFTPVAQLCYLTGRAVAVAAGPSLPLESWRDDARKAPRREQAAIELLLRALRESPQPVVITVLGSARIVTAAFNREPDLLRARVKSVVVNAGSTGDGELEYNVGLDVNAYVGLFRSGLPIDWYPCGAAGANRIEAFNAAPRNTFWKISHHDLFRGLPQPLLAWFVHGFSGNGRGDILRALDEQGRGASAEMILAGDRNMWSTASLALAAGRTLARTPEGWRFVPASKAAGLPSETLALEAVKVTIADDGRTRWEPTAGDSNIRLFRRNAGPAHDAAIREALNALLRSMPVD